MSDKNTTSEQLVRLPVSDIVPSGDNPRIINEKDQGFIDLLESIKAKGVIVPIHVRDHPREKGKYMLLAGERRLLAASKSQCPSIPAISYGKLNDEAAFEITFVENFGREDLTPLEQGKAATILLTKYKNDTRAVAAKMGRSVRWVLQRAAIDRNLSAKWQNAIVEYPSLRMWTAAHLGLIAALPMNVQQEILDEDVMDNWIYGNPPPIKELDKFITDRLRLLSKAPWDIEDAKLIDKVPACIRCPKRSSHQPGLFDDSDDIEAVKKNDRCLDQSCWEEKTTAYLKKRAAELKVQYPNLIFAVMPDEKIEYWKRNELSQTFGNIAYQWKASKEGAKEALPALIVHGKDIGQLRWIKCSELTSSTGKTEKTKAKPKSLKERRLLLDNKRWAQVLRNLIEQIENIKAEKLTLHSETKPLPTLYVITILASIMGTIERHEHLYKDDEDWKKFATITETSKADSEKGLKLTLEALWQQVKAVLISRLTYCGPITQTPTEYIDEAHAVAKLLEIDIEAMFKQVAKEVYPEPKSWKDFKADGTPKQSKGKKKKQNKQNKKRGQ